LTSLGGDDVHGDVDALDRRRRDKGRRGSSSGGIGRRPAPRRRIEVEEGHQHLKWRQSATRASTSVGQGGACAMEMMHTGVARHS